MALAGESTSSRQRVMPPRWRVVRVRVHYPKPCAMRHVEPVRSPVPPHLSSQSSWIRDRVEARAYSWNFSEAFGEQQRQRVRRVCNAFVIPLMLFIKKLPPHPTAERSSTRFTPIAIVLIRFFYRIKQRLMPLSDVKIDSAVNLLYALLHPLDEVADLLDHRIILILDEIGAKKHRIKSR